MSDTLLALAFLKVSWDSQGRSYLDNFNLITEECLRQSGSDVVSAPELKEAFRKRFGFHVPLSTVDALLRRARRRGLVRLEHGVLYVNRSALNNTGFQRERERLESAYSALAANISRFAESEYGLAWSDSKAESLMEDYLQTNAIAIFQASRTDSLLRVPKKTAKSERYVLAAYVNDALKDGSSRLDQLDAVVQGMMLANAILLPRPGERARRFKNTTVFLDTRLLLQGLGYVSPSLSEPVQELIRTLKTAGAELACFRHTRDEVRSVLGGVGRSLSGDSWTGSGFGETFDYFLQENFSESDVLVLVNRLDDALESLGAPIHEKPAYDRFLVDEDELESCLEQGIGYSNPYARTRDVDSISAVLRLRRDYQAASVEDSRALFATTNVSLVRAANRFYAAQAGDESPPVALTEWALSNLLWLKYPQEMTGLPRRRLIADCYAAVRPDPKFLERYFREIEKLKTHENVTEDDVYLLANSLEARQIAMDMTLGDEEAFTQGTVSEVLEVVRRSIEGEIKAELEEERRKRKTTERVALKRDAARASAKARRIQLAKRLAANLSNALMASGSLIIAVAIYLGLPFAGGPFKGGKLSALVAVILGILTFLNLTRGAFLRSALESLERKISLVAGGLLNRLAGELDDGEEKESGSIEDGLAKRQRHNPPNPANPNPSDSGR